MRISELSRRVGVTAETLRIWERRYQLLQPRRTAGNTRLYSAVDEARVRLMTRYLGEHLSAAQAAELAKAARISVRPGHASQLLDGEGRRVTRQMSEALDAFDESGADQALQQMLGEYSALVVIRDVLMPYLRELGERWERDHVSVAEEHFASNFVQSRLLALARGWDRGLGPRALLACPPEELHTFGLLAFGIGLHAYGWRIVCLGATTPIEMIAATARRLGPDLIAISASVDGRLDPHLESLRGLAASWPLVLAGPAVEADWVRRCGAEHLPQDPITAASRLAVSAR